MTREKMMKSILVLLISCILINSAKTATSQAEVTADKAASQLPAELPSQLQGQKSTTSR